MQGPGALAGQAALEALRRAARGEIVIARDDETAASRRDGADEPELMMAVRIVEQDMTALSPSHAREDRREIIETDGLRGGANVSGAGATITAAGECSGLQTAGDLPSSDVRVHAGKLKPQRRASSSIPAACVHMLLTRSVPVCCGSPFV